MLIFALLAWLIWIIRSREHLSLQSIGFNAGAIGKSLLWGLVGLLMCGAGLALALLLLGVLGLKMGGGSEGFVTPTYAVMIVVLRAGIVEEAFFRGYAIERLTALTHSKAVAVTLPLVLFSLFHYRQGFGGVIVALIMGGVLTGFYLWKRDLIANMSAHFLVDFIPNVLIPMIGRD
ncbi:MAG: CPBP family intramembrane glutamic endopeptidase [Dokdonella sp.]